MPGLPQPLTTGYRATLTARSATRGPMPVQDTPDSAAATLFGAPLVQGRWCVRLADPADLPALLRLRARAFRGTGSADDSDEFDAGSLHLWVGEPGGMPRATLRLRLHADRRALLNGYAARVYDLRAMAEAGGPVLELGRLCTDPDRAAEGDLLRLVWAGVARVALASGATRLIGCTSFPTTDTAALEPALALLAARHQGPEGLRPGRKAAETFGFEALRAAPDPAAAALLPPVLRVYLTLGGWVSDHLVIDRDLGTCHVFTCVDVAAMPAARRRVLTQMAGG